MRERPAPRTTIFLLLVLAAVLVWSAPARTAALGFLRFPFAVLSGSTRTLLLLPRLTSLSGEHARLREQLAQNAVEMAALREIIRQSNQAQMLLQRHSATRGIIAPVISRSLLPTQQTIMLGIGSRSGIAPDMVVLDADGVIGRVMDTQGDSATVLLLTDPDSRVAGLVERSRESGLLIGRAHRRLELTYLDSDAEIIEGDRVVTAGFGGIYPKGFQLGTVTKVVRDDVSGVARVVVKPAARFDLLEDVLCIPPAAGRGSP